MWEYRYTEDCILKDKCPLKCSPSCTIQPELYYLLENSNIPKRYIKPKTLHPIPTDYDVFCVLRDIQEDIEVFVQEGRILYLWGNSGGNGKAQPLYSKVLTPNGYITMGEVKVGTEVMGEDGKPHKVLGVFPQGKKPVYEVTFSDGSKCRCSDEHLWTVSIDHKKSWRTMTLADINKKPLCYSPNAHGKQGKHWKYHIPITKPLEFGNKSELPLDPWLLGALIGDGGFTHTTITFTNSEADIIAKVSNKLSTYNCTLVYLAGYDFGAVCNDNLGKKADVVNTVINPVREIIRKLGLVNHRSEDKFIPKEYLYSSVENRLYLLQGLFDTDGTIDTSRNSYSLSTSSKQLAKDIVFLVQSLGGTCSCNEHEAYYTYKGERKRGLNNYELYIKLPADFVPYTSTKHTNRFKGGKNNVYRTLRAIDYVGEEECQCILVDNPSHLYITDDMIVTHNTTFACKILKTYLLMKCMGNGFKDLAWFEYTPSFLLLAKNFEDKETRQEHINNLATRDLVVIDDIGAIRNTQYDIAVLSDIINTRYSKGLATIYTSNLSPDDLQIDERLKDRMASDIVLEIKGDSHRSSTNTYTRIAEAGESVVSSGVSNSVQASRRKRF